MLSWSVTVADFLSLISSWNVLIMNQNWLGLEQNSTDKTKRWRHNNYIQYTRIDILIIIIPVSNVFFKNGDSPEKNPRSSHKTNFTSLCHSFRGASYMAELDTSMILRSLPQRCPWNSWVRLIYVSEPRSLIPQCQWFFGTSHCGVNDTLEAGSGVPSTVRKISPYKISA